MPYRVTVRRGPRVERSAAPTLEGALDLVEAAAREVARTARPAPVELRFRTFAPAEQVAARIEVSGPSRIAPSVRAGVDVHGDGSMTAHRGRSKREAIEETTDESALRALRRVLLEERR
jgi:tryptophan synthase beta subunit